MKKVQASLQGMTLSLTLICLVAAALLAWVYTITKTPIAQAKELKQTQSLSKVLPPFDSLQINPEQPDVYKAFYQGNWVGTAIKTTGQGFGGDFVLMIGFDAQHHIVDYEVLNQQETPGLGTKMTTWFKKALCGYSMQQHPLKLTKDGGKIDAITAATISSRAFIKAVNKSYAVYSNRDITDEYDGDEKVETDGESGASKQRKDYDYEK